MKQVQQVVGQRANGDGNEEMEPQEPISLASFDSIEESVSKMKQSETAWLFDSRSMKSQSKTFGSRKSARSSRFEQGPKPEDDSQTDTSLDHYHSDDDSDSNSSSDPGMDARTKSNPLGHSSDHQSLFDPLQTRWSCSSPTLADAKSIRSERTLHARSLDMDDANLDSLASDAKDPFFQSDRASSAKSLSMLSMHASSFTTDPYSSHVSSTRQTSPGHALTAASHLDLLQQALPERMEPHCESPHTGAKSHHTKSLSLSNNLQSMTLNQYEQAPVEPIVASSASSSSSCSSSLRSSSTKTSPHLPATPRQDQADVSSILSFILDAKAPYELNDHYESIDQMLDVLIGQYERLGQVLQASTRDNDSK